NTMIFMPSVDFIDSDVNPRMKFVIGDNIYFMYDDDGKWVMQVMDTRTFNLSNLEVRGELDDFVHATFKTIVVHKEKAYFWSRSVYQFFEGTAESGCFRWRRIMLTSYPFAGVKFGYKDAIAGSNTYFCVISHDRDDVILRRLNLDTMTWTEDQVTGEAIRTHSLLIHRYKMFIVGQSIHLISEEHYANMKRHLVLDLSNQDGSLNFHEA
ncbi:hypothetical protein PENTCL1PPCAC_19379, partial [Pristionchus entomophagus]